MSENIGTVNSQQQRVLSTFVIVSFGTAMRWQELQIIDFLKLHAGIKSIVKSPQLL